MSRPVRWVCLLGLLLCGCPWMPGAAAAEPAEAFLTRLRAGGYYDIALLYLDRLDRLPGVPVQLREAADLERAQTHLEAAGAARSVQQRDQHFVSAEQALQSFLKSDSSGDHPRQSEARLQLGNLQMVRGAVLMESPKLDEQTRQKAREALQGAAATFDAIVEHLREQLQAMQGQRINAQDQPEKAALRDRYRVEYMQAQLRGGEARQRAAETYADPAKGGKKLLEEALARFTELSDKYSNYLPGAVAMLHRGQVQRMLGQDQAALDSFQRVLEEREAEALRTAKISAIAGAIPLWLASQPPKIQPAIDRGQAWVDGARPEERRSPEFQQLQLELAKAYLAKAADKATPGADRKSARTSARHILVAASRTPGRHQAEARKLLAPLGVEEPSSAASVSPPKSLQEAVTTARGLIETSDQLDQSRALLEQQLGGSSADADAVRKELESIANQQLQVRQQAVDVLRSGLAIAGPRADAALLNQARQFLAYVLYRSERLREAAVVGGFVARTGPGSDDGLRGGLLALTSLQTLLQQTGADAQAGVAAQINSLGQFLLQHWPDDPQAAAARGILIRIALSQERWQEARALLDETPTDSPEKAEFQRLMGQLTWNRYLALQQQEADAAQAQQLLTEAGNDLRDGLAKLQPDQVTPTDLQAALILSKVLLRQEQPKQALAVLDHSHYGPLVRLDKVQPPYENFSADVYAAALQAIVAQLIGAGGDSEQLLARAGQMMDRLRKSAAGRDDAEARLVQNYIALARDIRQQIDDAPPQRKPELIAAFRLFLARVADQSDDLDTLTWVGQTLSEMGQAAMVEPNRPATGQAAELLQSAATTLSSVLEKTEDQEKLLAIRFQLGRVYRLLGEYKQAIDQLATVLQKSPMMLDVQVEAAMTYQQWAARTQFAAKAYEFALHGSRPDPQTKKNVIWGWGKISQLTSGKPQFRDTFFDARYQIALCRYLQGKAEKNPATIERAANDIGQVAAMYPDLGNPQMREQFDVLLREIQRSLGQQADGLEALHTAATTVAKPDVQ